MCKNSIYYLKTVECGNEVSFVNDFYRPISTEVPFSPSAER